MSWPPHSHTSDPVTSHDAAELLNPTRDVALIVRFFADHDRPSGWTRFELREESELAEVVGRDEPLRRLSDAEARGFVGEMIDDNGPITRLSPYNRQQRAMRITDLGQAWLAGGASAAGGLKRQPRAALSPSEIVALQVLRSEHLKTQRGGWVIIPERDAGLLLELFERLGIKT